MGRTLIQGERPTHRSQRKGLHCAACCGRGNVQQRDEACYIGRSAKRTKVSYSFPRRESGRGESAQARPPLPRLSLASAIFSPSDIARAYPIAAMNEYIAAFVPCMGVSCVACKSTRQAAHLIIQDADERLEEQSNDA
jgi:hypothetical protein